MHFSKPIELYNTVNPNVNCRPKLTMYQYQFISCNKGGNNRKKTKLYWGGSGCIYGNSVLYAQLFCKPETALKNN